MGRSGWYIAWTFYDLMLLTIIVALSAHVYESRDHDPAWGTRLSFLMLCALFICYNLKVQIELHLGES